MEGYDSKLLAEAPESSRVQKQDGYDVRILGSADNGSPSAVHIGLRSTSNHDTPVVNRQDKDGYTSPYSQFADAAQKTPFWRTRRGIIILALLALLVVGAAVGGGVGGALGSKNHKTTSPSNGSDQGGSDGSGGQGGSDTNQGTSPQSSSVGDGVTTSSTIR